MTQANSAIRRGRAIRRSRAAIVGAGLSTGIAGAVLLAGSAPVALAATGKIGVTAVPATSVPSDAASARLEAASGAGQQCFPTFGLCKQITETLNPTSIAADGMSMSTATATVETCPIATPTTCSPVTTGQTVVFTSSDPVEKVGATTNHNDGTYSAVVTASTTVGQATITATDTFAVPGQSAATIAATATLTQVTGPGAKLVLAVSPASIVANGKSTSTALATVTDAQGHAVAGDVVIFTSSDHAEKITATTDHGDGTYTVTITSSKVAEVATITATDTSETPNLSGQAPLRQTAMVTPTVPATGAADELQLGGGAALLTFGIGVLATVARWRRRVVRTSG